MGYPLQRGFSCMCNLRASIMVGCKLAKRWCRGEKRLVVSLYGHKTIHGHGSVRPNGSSNRPTKANLLASGKNSQCPPARGVRPCATGLPLPTPPPPRWLAAAHAASSADGKSPTPSWCASTRASSPTRVLWRPPRIELVEAAPHLIHRRVYGHLVAGLEVQPQHRDASAPIAPAHGTSMAAVSSTSSRRRWWAAPASRRRPPSDSPSVMPLVAPPHGNRRPYYHGYPQVWIFAISTIGT
jgi:hypothetical protein